MGDHDEGIRLDEDELLGADGDNAEMTDDDHLQDLSAMEAQMAELEEEQKKLRQIQSDLEGQMNLSGSAQGSQSGMNHLTPEEKAEADARSVYVGNVDYSVTAEELETHFHGCGSVNRVTILCDKFTGHPKGFAYLEFAEKEGVQNALAMTDSLLKGRQIKVSAKRTNRPGISTTNRPPRGRGGFYGRGRGGVVIKYVYAGGYRPRGRAMRRRPGFSPFIQTRVYALLVMESNLQYAEQSYWDKRFETECNFEWLADFHAFHHLILPKLRPDARILHIGCGSSQLSMELYKKGYTNITNVDYSPVLIEACKERHPEMRWICDDIRSLSSLSDESFDVVIEKATLEALLVAEKSQWSPSDDALLMLDSVFSAVSRVLIKGGLFVSVSFTQPHFRLPALLRQPSWGVELEEFGTTFHFFVYSCRLGATTSPELRDRFAHIAPEWQRNVSVRA